MAVSQRLRYEVLRRDNHACRYCGAAAPDVPLTVDHVIPVALGGSDDPSNLVTACRPCNSGKAASVPDAPLVADVAADALRWARAMQVASIAISGEHAQRDDAREHFRRQWLEWTYTATDGTKKPFPLPSDWMHSIDALTAAGMDSWIRGDAVDEAMMRKGVQDRFRYFCGIAWKSVRRMQEIARQVLDAEDAVREAGGS